MLIWLVMARQDHHRHEGKLEAARFLESDCSRDSQLQPRGVKSNPQ